MKSTIGLGNILAFILSYQRWHSVLLALFHGLFGWLYVFYYGFFYWGSGALYFVSYKNYRYIKTTILLTEQDRCFHFYSKISFAIVKALQALGQPA